MKPETGLKHWARKRLEKHEIRIQPIESGQTGNGIPDWYYATMCVEGWIEFKQLEALREPIVIPFRAGQFSWLMNHVAYKRLAFLFVGFSSASNEKYISIFKNLQIQREYTLDTFTRECIICARLTDINGLTLFTTLNDGGYRAHRKSLI